MLLLFSPSFVSDSLWPYGLQHARLPVLPCLPECAQTLVQLSWWCRPTISSSVTFFFSFVTFLSMQNLKYKMLLSLKSFSCCFSSPLNFQFWKCCPTAHIKYYFTVRILSFLGEKNLLISLKIHWKQNGVLNTGNKYLYGLFLKVKAFIFGCQGCFAIWLHVLCWIEIRVL